MTNEELQSVANEHGGIYISPDALREQYLHGEVDSSYAKKSDEQQTAEELGVAYKTSDAEKKDYLQGPENPNLGLLTDEEKAALEHGGQLGMLYGQENFNALTAEEVSYIKEHVDPDRLTNTDKIAASLSDSALNNLIQRRRRNIEAMVNNYELSTGSEELKKIGIKLDSDIRLIESSINSMNKIEELVKLKEEINEYLKNIQSKKDIKFKAYDDKNEFYDSIGLFVTLKNMIDEKVNKLKINPIEDEPINLESWKYESYPFLPQSKLPEEEATIVDLASLAKNLKSIDIIINSLSSDNIIKLIERRFLNSKAAISNFKVGYSDSEIEKGISLKLDSDFRLIYALILCGREDLDMNYISNKLESYREMITKSGKDFIMFDGTNYKGIQKDGYLTASKVLELLNQKVLEYSSGFTK